MDDLDDKPSPAQRGSFSTPIQGPNLKPIDSQFTSPRFTGLLTKAGIRVSMDGKRCERALGSGRAITVSICGDGP